MAVGFSNYAATTITDAGGITAGALAFTVASNAGMPSTLPFIARLTQFDANGDVTAYEFVRVTAQGGTGNRTWTITRAQESTVAIAHPQNTQVSNPLTAGVMNEDLIIIDSETYYDSTFKRLSLGSNALLPSYRLEVGGSEANNTLGAGVDSRVHIYNRNSGAVGRLAELTYGAAINSSYATISSYLQSAANNTQGGIIISTRRLTADANPTEAVRISYTGAVGIKTAGEPTANTDLDVNGVLAVSAGAVGAPSYTFRGDLNTGFWNPTGDVIAVSVGGSEIIRINSTGLSIGVGAVPAYRLDVRGPTASFHGYILNTSANGADVGSCIGIGGTWNTADPVAFTTVWGKKESGTAGNYDGYFMVETAVTGVGYIERLRIKSGGTVQPGGNKTQDFGTTALRWATVFNATNTTGTSRLCDSINDCPDCQKPMKRGTGVQLLLGETEDYIQTFCPDCGHTGFETLAKLPRAMLAQRRSAPLIHLDGIRVNAMSGNSYLVYVDFIYGWEAQEFEEDEGLVTSIHQTPIRNSTILGQTEIEHFFSLSTPEEKRQYLLELGQREWDAMEEARLMEEEVVRVQQRFNEAIFDLAGTNLLGVN